MPASAELEGWSEGNRRSREEYRRNPVVTPSYAAEKIPETVPRARMLLMARANAELSRENRALRAALAEAKRRLALAEMRRGAPRR